MLRVFSLGDGRAFLYPDSEELLNMRPGYHPRTGKKYFIKNSDGTLYKEMGFVYCDGFVGADLLVSIQQIREDKINKILQL
jgi:hypothetical protein